MNAVGNHLDVQAFQRQRGARHTRRTVVQRVHAVEQMRYLRKTPVQCAFHRLIAGITVTGGNPNPLCGGSTDECFCPRKFRCKRHQADDLLRSIRQALEVFHGGQLVGTRILERLCIFH